MNKAIYFALAAAASMAASGELVTMPTAGETPAATAGDSPIIFVNVASALEGKAFGDTVAKVAAMLPCAVGTDSALALPDLVHLKASTALANIPDAPKKLAVFVIDDDTMPEVLSSPHNWAVANIAPLDADHPDAVKLEMRRAKVLLRALAYAAGSGGTLETRCLMSKESQSLTGLDAAPFAISPMAWLPMLEFLEGFSGVMADDEE